jgi:outer membrane protein assembly factor BamB
LHLPGLEQVRLIHALAESAAHLPGGLEEREVDGAKLHARDPPPATLATVRRALWLALLALVASGCGSSDGGSASTERSSPASGTAAPARSTSSDWTRFDFDAARSGVGPRRTGIGASNLRGLRRRQVKLPGTVDSSPIYLARLKVAGKRRRGVFFVTTTYGITLAIDAESGRTLWKFEPNGIRAWEGSSQITNTTPVADPSRRAIYAASPNGQIHKLSVASGREASGWPATVTRDASHEKLASALNVSGRNVLATTGGYIGDAPPYQGHVLAINRSTGTIAHVFNSLCSDRQDQVIDPSSCDSSDSAIWARAGAVVIPGSHRILVATGNAPFNGRTDWGDSVLMLAPDASKLLQSYAPADQAQLNDSDADLGSTVAAPLPLPGRGKARYRYAAQGGKDGKLKLLSLSKLNGTGTAGPQTGHEVQLLDGTWTFTHPVTWRSRGRVFVLSADNGGTVAYEFRGRSPRLHVLWRNGTAGSSPVLAGGLLYVFDTQSGGINVYRPRSGRKVGTLASGSGHWNSPIVVDGRIALGEGNANDHDKSGVLDIWSR